MKTSKLQSKIENWEVKRLNEVCEVNPRTVLSQSNGMVKYVEMAAIDKNLKEIKYFLDRPINKVSSGTPKFMNNDVIFARITPCTENGKVAFVENCDGVCAGSTELHVLRARQEVLLPRFLFYLLIRPEIKDMAVASMSGTTGRQRVPAEFFHYLKIPIPPLSIQHQIVEQLDAIRKTQELNDKQIALAEELFQSLLHSELNTKGKNWEIKRLGEVSKVKGGKRVPKGKRLTDAKTNHPYIRVVDFKDFSVDLSNLKYIDDETFKVIKNYTISKDEIYISIAGTTGVAGTIPAVLDGANLTENAAKLILKNKDLEKMFLVYFLASDFGQLQLQRSTYAPGIPKLALYRLERIKIPTPPPESQRQIVQKLQAVQDYKKSSLAQKEKLKELFESTLDKAMTPQSHFAPAGQEGELGRFYNKQGERNGLF